MGTSGGRLDPVVLHAAAVEAVEGLDLVPAVAGKMPESYVPPRLTTGGLATAYVQPRMVDLDPDEPIAPLARLDLLDAGCKGEYGSTTFDDTAKAQAAVDRLYNEGGGILEARPGPRFRIEQLTLKEGVFLDGLAPGLAGVGRPRAGGEVIQAEGSSVDMVIGTGTTDPGGGNYLQPCGIRNITLYGNPGLSPLGKSGFAAKAADGTPLNWQHGCSIDNVIVTGFQKDGIWIPGGSGVQHISHVWGYMNGGYVVRIGEDAAGVHSVQHVHLIDISGDGNSGGAVVRIENQSADYETLIQGLKSEQVINFLVNPETSPGGSVVSQAHALHLHDCDSDVVVAGVQHIAGEVWSVIGGTATVTPDWGVTGGTKAKPGAPVRITNSNTGKRPTVIYQGKKIRCTDSQIAAGGPDPAWIQDESNGSTVNVPNDHTSGMYGGGARAIVTREQTSGTFRKILGKIGDHILPGNTTHELALRGTIPGLHLFADSAPTDAKSAVLRNYGDGRVGIRAYKDDLTTLVGDMILFKSVAGVITQFGVRGLLVDFPTFVQTAYATATRTVAAPSAAVVATTPATQSTPYGFSQAQADALVAAVNALVVDVAGVKQNLNSVIDDLQANGIFK